MLRRSNPNSALRMTAIIKNSLLEAQRALTQLLADEAGLTNIETAATLLIQTLQNGGRIYSCGNGGSMCDAMHFAEELTGRYRKNRRGFAAAAISDAGHMSCVANDFGYDHVFSRFVETHGRPGDCLVALSTSGKSPNILNAALSAQAAGVSVITLTGKRASPLGALATVDVCTPAGEFADRVQELHIKVLHILIESIERALCPELY
jgi:D-sedoheptulose 7-phosphate isomerase